jgi:hypothetical protein
MSFVEVTTTTLCTDFWEVLTSCCYWAKASLNYLIGVFEAVAEMIVRNTFSWCEAARTESSRLFSITNLKGLLNFQALILLSFLFRQREAVCCLLERLLALTRKVGFL